MVALLDRQALRLQPRHSILAVQPGLVALPLSPFFFFLLSLAAVKGMFSTQQDFVKRVEG